MCQNVMWHTCPALLFLFGGFCLHPTKSQLGIQEAIKAFSTAKSDRKSSCVHVLPVSVGSFLVPRLHSTVERGFSRVFGTHSSDLYLTIMALWKTCLGLAVSFNLVFCEIVSNKIVTNSSFILTPDGC